MSILTWALIFSNCSSSSFWVIRSFLVRLVFSSSRPWINFFCSSSFTVIKEFMEISNTLLLQIGTLINLNCLHQFNPITGGTSTSPVMITFNFLFSKNSVRPSTHQQDTDLWSFDFCRFPCCPWVPAALGAVSVGPPGQSAAWWSSQCPLDCWSEPSGAGHSGSGT